MWGATPVTESVAAVVTERTGVRWLPAYGASELPVIAANPVDRPDAWRLDSAGLPPRRGGAAGRRPRDRRGAPARRDRRDPGPQPVGDGRLPARGGHRRRVRRRLVPHRRRRLARARGLGPPHRSVQGDDQGQRLPGGAGRDRGRAARPSRRCSTARCSACPTSGPARCRSPSCSSTRPSRSPTASSRQLVADSLADLQAACATSSSSTRSRGCPSGKVLRRTLRDEWTPRCSRRRGATPDGRPTLAGAAAPCATRRPRSSTASARAPSAELDDRRAGREARRRHRRRRAGASCAATDDGARRWRRRSRWRSSPRSSAAASPTRRSSARRSPPTCAAWPARRRPRRAETVAARRRPRPALAAVAGRRARRPARWPSTPRARPPRSCWCPAPDGYRARARSPVPSRRAARSTSPARSPSIEPGTRRRRWSTGQTRSLDRRRPRPMDGPRARADLRRPRRRDARRRASCRSSTPPSARQYGAADRVVPGGPAPARRRARRRWRARGASPSTPPGPSTPSLPRRRVAAGVGRQGLLPPGRPAPCARPRSRCTAASATPGSASPTCTCAGRCCRSTCSAASAPTSTGCWPTTGSEVA